MDSTGARLGFMDQPSNEPWFKQRAKSSDELEQRGWDPANYIQAGLLVAFLGGLAAGGTYAYSAEFAALVAGVVTAIASTLWLIGVIAKGVQVGRRWP